MRDDKGNFWDYRINMGPHCFASNEATLKYFDQTTAETLVNYDLFPEMFEGLPGNWLIMRRDEFQAGEMLDAGPVVHAGKCERID
jgi:hypothetical protein